MQSVIAHYLNLDSAHGKRRVDSLILIFFFLSQCKTSKIMSINDCFNLKYIESIR